MGRPGCCARGELGHAAALHAGSRAPAGADPVSPGTGADRAPGLSCDPLLSHAPLLHAAPSDVLLQQKEAGLWPLEAAPRSAGPLGEAPSPVAGAPHAGAPRYQLRPRSSSSAGGASGGSDVRQEHGASALAVGSEHLGWGKCGGVLAGRCAWALTMKGIQEPPHAAALLRPYPSTHHPSARSPHLAACTGSAPPSRRSTCPSRPRSCPCCRRRRRCTVRGQT
jgi:hypothetical protein